MQSKHLFGFSLGKRNQGLLPLVCGADHRFHPVSCDCGQLKLSKSSILVVGSRGLGSPVALYLTACGAGYRKAMENTTISFR
ncbi:adenylyltransferase and sulfurtransferase UBA4-like [Dioscorea cayenensis subsp. rotundata]|uniref:Adenylyltransferase and sulfurtransferase UBA4-like n=1 Tax=Dioscorea cayennensis subsp. rotundata TaxID=55577 RepID=A0AB40BGJ3_DIOCR|nr:adenylyltransferase and sulfurtransferase UBA4-like [Dioscorea cayenensis subsp. rotundata]